MTDIEHELPTLIDQIRHGSETASQDLVAKYGMHILRVVRHRLNRALRPKFDSQDFVQAVWASFFAVLPTQRGFGHPEELIAFLSQLAQNKVIDAVRQRLQSQRMNVNREEPGGLSATAAERIDPHQLSPAEIAIAREEWGRLLDQQPTQYQRILELLRAGHGRDDVARELGVNERTIRRVIERLAARRAQ